MSEQRLLTFPLILARSERLVLRAFTLGDATWVLPLLNDDAFLTYIGDKGVRTLAQAEDYLENGPLTSYSEHGFGLAAVVRARDLTPVGMAGVLVRPTLPQPDIGYAICPEMRGQGFGREASAMVLDYAHRTLGFPRVLAIVTPTNAASRRVLQSLGFQHESMHRSAPDAPEVELYAHNV